MLHWQRKKLPLRTRIWSSLFVFSVVGHIVLFGGLLLWYDYRYSSVIINVNRAALDDTTIVLLPFCKQVKQVSSNPSTGSRLRQASTDAAGRAVKKEATKVKKKIPTQLKKPVAANPSSRKASSDQGVLSGEQARKLQQKVQQEKLTYVGQDDLRALNLEVAIQKEVKRFWKPPAGLSNGLSCKFTVRVGERGQVEHIKLLASSSVLVYDACARTALGRMTFPRAAYHKEITMVF